MIPHNAALLKPLEEAEAAQRAAEAIAFQQALAEYMTLHVQVLDNPHLRLPIEERTYTSVPLDQILVGPGASHRPDLYVRGEKKLFEGFRSLDPSKKAVLHYGPQRDLVAGSRKWFTKMRARAKGKPGPWVDCRGHHHLVIARFKAYSPNEGDHTKWRSGAVPWQWFLVDGQHRVYAFLDVLREFPNLLIDFHIVLETFNTDEEMYNDYFMVTDNGIPRGKGCVSKTIARAKNVPKTFEMKVMGAAQLADMLSHGVVDRTAKRYTVDENTGKFSEHGVPPNPLQMSLVTEEWGDELTAYIESYEANTLDDDAFAEWLKAFKKDARKKHKKERKALAKFFICIGTIARGLTNFRDDPDKALDFWIPFFNNDLDPSDIRHITRQRVAFNFNGKPPYFQQGHPDDNTLKLVQHLNWMWQLFLAGRHLGFDPDTNLDLSKTFKFCQACDRPTAPTWNLKLCPVCIRLGAEAEQAEQAATATL